MNLVPIASGGAPSELAGSGSSPEGDFATLMAGLMSGDTQIVPSIDVPVVHQPPPEAEQDSDIESTDDGGSILGFIGSPPAGIVSPVPTGASDMTASAPAETNESVTTLPIVSAGQTEPIVSAGQTEPAVPTGQREPAVPTGQTEPAVPTLPAEAGAPTDQGSGDTTLRRISPALGDTAPVGDGSIAPRADTATTTEPDLGSGLASVHPISSASVATPPTETSGPQAPHSALASTPDAAASSPAPGTPSPAAPSHVPDQPVTLPVTGQPAVSAPGQQPDPVREQAPNTIDPATVDADFEVETGAIGRTADTAARPGPTVSQPAMVGIARRVEEAIAALATKPDPKIVTLQLDELDGIRLTVALRPDGLHLSSTGDTTLAGEIERALASRGFDMASDRQKGREGAEQGTDDGWQPEPTDRRRRTNPSGIRL